MSLRQLAQTRGPELTGAGCISYCRILQKSYETYVTCVVSFEDNIGVMKQDKEQPVMLNVEFIVLFQVNVPPHNFSLNLSPHLYFR